MSEFFKALEQAERDRQLAERNEQSATVAEAGEPDGQDDGATPGRIGAAPAVEAPAAAAAPPVAPPPAARPVEGPRRISVFTRPPVPVERPGPMGGDRAVAAERIAPSAPAPEPPVAERAPAPARERVTPPAPERVPPPPRERVTPPAAERVPPAPREQVTPPAAERVPPAPREQVTPPAAERVPPAPREQVTPPAAARVAPPEREARPIEADPPPLQRTTTRPPRRRDPVPVLIADLDPRSVAAEAYRTLRANLEFMPSERGCRHIVITSPSMGEGKSTTVANLAVVAAQAGSRVCLVDADMRRPTMHRVFGVPNQGGFTRALSQAMPLASVAIPTAVPNLSLVVAGSSDGLRPAQLLNAPRLQKVLHDPATPFDLVLFDTPPIISVADAMNLAAHCDGVVLVVRAGAVPPSVLQQAVRQVEQVKGKVLGVLLNQVDLRRGEAEFYRYYRAYYSTSKKDQ